MRALIFIPLLLALAACGGDDDLPPPPGPPSSAAESPTAEDTSAAQPDDTGEAGETGEADETGETGETGDSASLDWSSPSYESCITDAQCAPGDACTTVPGYAGLYCAPPCDPEGDASECAIDGIDFETTCTTYGRCARSCEVSDDTAADSVCPEGLECADVSGEGMCAGDVAALSGYYGLCSHPNVEGTDCPEDASCVGGDLLGSKYGVCLPWCPDYTCPDPEGEVSDVTPYCYDVGLGDPVCGLLCTADESVCPEGQVCFEIYSSVGLCAPPDAVNPF